MNTFYSVWNIIKTVYELSINSFQAFFLGAWEVVPPRLPGVTPHKGEGQLNPEAHHGFQMLLRNPMGPHWPLGTLNLPAKYNSFPLRIESQEREDIHLRLEIPLVTSQPSLLQSEQSPSCSDTKGKIW